MNGWLVALLGLGGAALYLAARSASPQAASPAIAPNYVATGPAPAPSSNYLPSSVAIGGNLARTPAWALTPAGQAWAVANEQDNVVNPPGTPGWYAWQAAHPAPTSAGL